MGVASCGLVLTACVPATDPTEPAGAAGFVTEPSPASRGEPFTTDDGWTLHFEDVAFQGSVMAQPVITTYDGYSSDSDYVRWNVRDRTVLFARALKVGRWRAYVSLYNAYSPYNDEPNDIVSQNIDPKLARRFAEPANDDVDEFWGYASPPVAIILLRAEKDGRTLRLDVALSRTTSSPSLDAGSEIDVRSDALTTSPLALDVERLFLATTRETGEADRFEFEPFAEADAEGNDDGVITNDELKSTSVRCPRCDEDESPLFGGSLLEVLRSRVPAIFGYP